MMRLLSTLLAVWLGLAVTQATAQDPLPSWRDGPARQAILRFVDTVTTPGSPGFVPPPERIAVFDNDGTLWVEQPAYTQLLFALDRVRALAPQNPNWATREPFKSALAGDMAGLAAAGERGLLELVMATHAGMTPEAFQATASAWLETARHPRFGRRFDSLVYQPMLELLTFLRAKDFKTYIVSGGGIELVRAFSERVYGIPPEQVVGSTIVTTLVQQDGRAVLIREPKVDFIDDKAGKPVAINRHIGRRPIAAFGNSDGDLEMLQWTTEGSGPRLGVIIRHDDAEREYAYDRASHVGRLDKALDMAGARGWTVVSMKTDWTTIFPGTP
jgi:phosphoserine phosphatase